MTDTMLPIEVEALADPADTVAVPLADREIRILPVRKWKSSALRALRQGDFETWAERSLVAADVAVWQAVDPDMDQVEAMFSAWTAKTGQTPGN